MSSDEAKRIVSDDLERRREAQHQAIQEARLEKYEKDMIGACNEHCADAKVQRMLYTAGQRDLQAFMAKRAAQRAAWEAEQEKEEAATMAAKRYAITCMVILWVSACTPLPLWAAITLALGLAVFPAVYIFRLYYPL